MGRAHKYWKESFTQEKKSVLNYDLNSFLISEKCSLPWSEPLSLLEASISAASIFPKANEPNGRDSLGINNKEGTNKKIQNCSNLGSGSVWKWKRVLSLIWSRHSDKKNELLIGIERNRKPKSGRMYYKRKPCLTRKWGPHPSFLIYW